MRFPLSVLLLFLAMQFCSGQSASFSLQDKNLVELRQLAQKTSDSFQRSAIFLRPGFTPFLSNTSATQPIQVSATTSPLPPAWRYEDLALFCKIEVKMEKALNMPVKVRLGEVQYVERMEGKLQTGVNYKQ